MFIQYYLIGGALLAISRSFALLEAKAKAGLKVQIEKLQLERDEFQRMVIRNQERLNQVMVEKKKECRSGMEIMR
ncbi:hypothetical protein L6452_43100 [Arctium lappa]|uniref:Uncharacterized protein n=1 Tax=Arctium lappa TaxID=4217 RepID=A0ACB8XLB4_ARCLA|nr:hypothetical protein L6452_43100 [Arctium lappa]